MGPTAYRRNARGLRDRQAFEHIRMQAGQLFAAGHTHAEVAGTLSVARQNVSRWHARWQAGGLQALASRGPTGPDPRLSDQQLHDLDQHRPLDPSAQHHRDPAGHRAPLPSRPHLEAAAPHGLAGVLVPTPLRPVPVVRSGHRAPQVAAWSFGNMQRAAAQGRRPGPGRLG